MSKLTQMQYNFTQNYISNGFNAYRAAIDAGYSESFALVKAGSLVDKPEIKTRIERAYARIEDRLELELSITIADKAKALASIVYDILPQDGSEPKRKLYNEAMKAIDMLNKMQGHYMPDKKLSVTVDATKEKLKEVKRLYDEY